MAKKTTKNSNILSVISFITLLVILVSVFVLSGSFSDLLTTINKSKASQANPKVTESFSDVFKDGVINDEKWVVTKTEGVNVTENSNDLLRIGVSAGGISGKAKNGILTFKELIKNKGDFRAVAVVYKPIVTGDGTGITAFRFSSSGSEDKEMAAVRWVVNGTSSKIVFTIIDDKGKRLETNAVEVRSNVAVLRLDRINKKYRAFYKVGADTTADVSWISLGADMDASLGNEGYFSLTTHNGGVENKFPQVVGRFDQVAFAWEGDPKTSFGFSDAFANGVLDDRWRVIRSAGVQVYENAADNLVASLTSGSVGGKPRYASIVRKDPTVPLHKDFVFNAGMFKPVVVGSGQGRSSIGFVSAGNENDEAAHIHWVVSGNTISKIVFATRAADGTLVQRASIDIPVTVKRLTIRLVRTGDQYSAKYRIGDNDADFVAIGNAENSSFGADGRVMLSVNNIGASNAFPRVVGRFDQVTGHVVK